MKNISFLSENFQFLEVKFSIYLNRRVFVMRSYKSNKFTHKKMDHAWSSVYTKLPYNFGR